VQLQSVVDKLDQAGYALYAISYDGTAVLDDFASKHGITYPLLSDEDSAVIGALGLLNEEAGPQVVGIPHPGTFVLNRDGTVRSKHFYANYRERDTGIGVLEHLLGMDASSHGNIREVATDAVSIRAWFDTDTYAWGQRLWLTVELDVPSGLHVYGRPISEGYRALDVEVEPLDRLVVGKPVYPEAKPFRAAGLDESFHVYDGRVRVQVPITFMVVDGGTLEIAVNVSFQACSETDCGIPQAVRLVLPIAEHPLVERPQRPQ